MEVASYLAGGDHDSDLLNRLGELLGLDSAVVIKVEVLEGLEEHLFLALDATGFLAQLVLEFFLEAAQSGNAATYLAFNDWDIFFVFKFYLLLYGLASRVIKKAA